MSADAFHSEYASVMESMMKTAMAQTTKLVESMVDDLKAEISRVRTENELLRSACARPDERKSQGNHSAVQAEDTRLSPAAQAEDYRSAAEKLDRAVQCDLANMAELAPLQQHQHVADKRTKYVLRPHRSITDDDGNSQMTFTLVKHEHSDAVCSMGPMLVSSDPAAADESQDVELYTVEEKPTLMLIQKSEETAATPIFEETTATPIVEEEPAPPRSPIISIATVMSITEEEFDSVGQPNFCLRETSMTSASEAPEGHPSLPPSLIEHSYALKRPAPPPAPPRKRRKRKRLMPKKRRKNTPIASLSQSNGAHHSDVRGARKGKVGRPRASKQQDEEEEEEEEEVTDHSSDPGDEQHVTDDTEIKSKFVLVWDDPDSLDEAPPDIKLNPLAHNAPVQPPLESVPTADSSTCVEVTTTSDGVFQLERFDLQSGIMLLATASEQRTMRDELLSRQRQEKAQLYGLSLEAEPEPPQEPEQELVREEAAKQAQEEAAKRAREEAKRARGEAKLAREEAAKQARKEAKQAREEAKQAREEAKRVREETKRVREEEAKRAREEAKRARREAKRAREEEAKRAREEEENRAREEEGKRVREEEEKRVREEEEKRVREEEEKRVREEEEKRVREEEEKRVREEEEKRVREEEEKRVREVEEKRAREVEEKRAREVEEKRAREEEEKRAREEEEKRAREEEEKRAREEEEKRAREEEEKRAREEEEKRAREEEKRAREEEEKRAREEEEKRAREEQKRAREEEQKRVREEKARLQEEAKRAREEKAKRAREEQRLQEEAKRLRDEEMKRVQEEAKRVREEQRLQEIVDQVREEEAKQIQEEEAKRAREEGKKAREEQKAKRVQEKIKQVQEAKARRLREEAQQEKQQEKPALEQTIEEVYSSVEATPDLSVELQTSLPYAKMNLSPVVRLQRLKFLKASKKPFKVSMLFLGETSAASVENNQSGSKQTEPEGSAHILTQLKSSPCPVELGTVHPAEEPSEPSSASTENQSENKKQVDESPLPPLPPSHPSDPSSEISQSQFLATLAVLPKHQHSEKSSRKDGADAKSAYRKSRVCKKSSTTTPLHHHRKRKDGTKEGEDGKDVVVKQRLSLENSDQSEQVKAKEPAPGGAKRPVMVEDPTFFSELVAASQNRRFGRPSVTRVRLDAAKESLGHEAPQSSSTSPSRSAAGNDDSSAKNERSTARSPGRPKKIRSPEQSRDVQEGLQSKSCTSGSQEKHKDKQSPLRMASKSTNATPEKSAKNQGSFPVRKSGASSSSKAAVLDGIRRFLTKMPNENPEPATSSAQCPPVKKVKLVQTLISSRKSLSSLSAARLRKSAKAKAKRRRQQLGKKIGMVKTKGTWIPPTFEESEVVRLQEEELAKKEAESSFPGVDLMSLLVKKEPITSPLQPLTVIGKHLLRNQCGECGCKFSCSAALEKHVSMHYLYRPFTCKLCGKCYPNSKAFKRHDRVHRNGRIHVCPQCGKGFVYRYGLAKHIRMVHSRIKPFVCQICNKSYATRQDVESHTRSHTGEKPFSCDFCEKRFVRRVQLNMHLRRHLGERRFWCPECNKGFMDLSNMKKHLLTHTGLKPHACPHCPKTYTQAVHMRKHIQTVHCFQ